MVKPLEIDGIKIGPKQPVYVIADIGSNHNKDMETARQLIRECKRVGVHAVKLQTYKQTDMYSKKSPKWGMYDQTPYDLIADVQWPEEWQNGRAETELANYAKEIGITLLTTPFGERATESIINIVPVLKVASFEVGAHKFLAHLGRLAAPGNKPIIMSTGARFMDEVRESVDTLTKNGVKNIILLHCVSNYPSNPQDCNLRAIKTHADSLPYIAGFSDHVDMHEAIANRIGDKFSEAGIISGALAVLMGAHVLEKHVTLDRTMKGPDHGFAIEPEELKEYIALANEAREAFYKGKTEELLERYRQQYDYTDAMLGDGRKRPMPSEAEPRAKGYRFLYAAEDLGAGSILEAEHVQELRGGTEDGVKPKYAFKENLVLGKELVQPIVTGDLLTWSHLGMQPPKETHSYD